MPRNGPHDILDKYQYSSTGDRDTACYIDCGCGTLLYQKIDGMAKKNCSWIGTAFNAASSVTSITIKKYDSPVAAMQAAL